MTTPRKDLPRQSPWIIIVAVCAILMCCVMLGLGLLVVSRQKARMQPPQFAGDWSVIGLQGDSRGTITFTPDGEIDSHDGFVGKWRLEDGTIYVQFWKKSPSSLIQQVFPKRDEFAFTTTSKQENRPSVLRGANVVLTRVGTTSQ